MQSAARISPLLLILLIIIVSALIAGGVVYSLQLNQVAVREAHLQNQIDGLRSQLATTRQPASSAAVAVSPSPSPIATAIPTSAPTPAPTATPVPALTTSQLLNATYAVPSFTGSYKLKDGTTIIPLPTGDGSLTLDKNFITQGDLNGDGVADVVAIIWTNGGGTGYFPSIVAIINKNGQPVEAADTDILSDRASVDSLTISKGIITMKGRIHGPGQSGSDEANTPQTEVYKLVGSKLVAQ